MIAISGVFNATSIARFCASVGSDPLKMLLTAGESHFKYLSILFGLADFISSIAASSGI